MDFDETKYSTLSHSELILQIAEKTEKHDSYHTSEKQQDEIRDKEITQLILNICEDETTVSCYRPQVKKIEENIGNYVQSSSMSLVNNMPENFLNNSELDIPAKSVLNEIQKLVEYYLSDEYLTSNSFLVKHIQNNKLGFVSIKLMASFKKLASITNHYILAVASSQSTILQLNENWTRVRRVRPVPDEIFFKHSIIPKNSNSDKPSKLNDFSEGLMVNSDLKTICGKNFVSLSHFPAVSSAPGSSPEQSTPFGAVIELLKPFFADLLSVTLIRPNCQIPLRFKEWILSQSDFRYGNTIAIAEFLSCEAADKMVDFVNSDYQNNKSSISVKLCDPRTKMSCKVEKKDHSPCFHITPGGSSRSYSTSNLSLSAVCLPKSSRRPSNYIYSESSSFNDVSMSYLQNESSNKVNNPDSISFYRPHSNFHSTETISLRSQRYSLNQTYSPLSGQANSSFYLSKY